MDNFITQLDSSEMVISLYHPKIFHLYQQFGDMIQKRIYSKFSDTTKKLFDHLKDLEKGVTPDGFRLKCESLGFANDFIEDLVGKFNTYSNLQDDDYTALFMRVRNFIVDDAIKEAVDNYNENQEVDAFIDRINSLKMNELSSKFSDPTLYSSCLFGDIDVKSVQETFVQGTIKSSINIINQASSLGGYLKGQMVVIAAPTKCFVGSTRVVTGNGESMSFEEMVNNNLYNVPVRCYNEELNKFSNVYGYLPRVTGFRDQLVKVHLSNGKVIECTPEHPFLLRNRSYKPAQFLTQQDILMTENTEDDLIATYIEDVFLAYKIPVYDLSVPEYENFLLEDGVYVHNCGKSMVSMQETQSFLKQGLNVVYSAFGDLKLYDFLYRMSSQINHKPMPYTENHLEQEVAEAKRAIPNINTQLDLQLLAPDCFTASMYADHLKTSLSKDGKRTIHEWADVIIVDYDSNLASGAENMYTKGEDIYQQLYQLVYPDKLLIVLAQTNKASWDQDIITLGELGESSRKQQIIDILLTISKPPCKNPSNQVGVMNICAGRRCKQMKTPYFRDIDGCFHEISANTFDYIKESANPKTYIKDISKYRAYLSDGYDVMQKSDSNAPNSTKKDNLNLPEVEESYAVSEADIDVSEFAF